MNLAVQGQVVKWNLDRVTICGVLFSREETVLPDGIHMEKPYDRTWNFSPLEKHLIWRCGRVFVVLDYSGEPSETREELDKFCDISIPIIVKLDNKEFLLGNQQQYQTFFDTLSMELLKESPQLLHMMKEYGISNYAERGQFELGVDGTECADLMYDTGNFFNSFKTLIPLEQLRRKLDDGNTLRTLMPDGTIEELPRNDRNFLEYLKQRGKVVIVRDRQDSKMLKLLMLVFDGWTICG